MILYAEQDNTIYITVSGHITAQYCTQLKVKVFERFEEEPAIDLIYVDMAECTYIDSTFLGLLAGFNKKLLRACGNRLQILQVNNECRSLMAGMGLLSVLQITEKPIVFPQTMNTLSGNGKSSPEDILHAHEDLMELSESNKQKFATLHQILSGQIKNDSQ